ncbi:MAG: hypothetical protein IPH16_00440 [Haliscomenobacter sp.]|nr:hypothetical protein [Haliscomenobacter sp.]
MLNKDQRTGMFLSGLENRPVTEKKYRTIYADVQFGQPSMRCRGSGICRVDLYRGSLHNERSKCARAIAMIEWKDGKVHLLFSKYAICRHLAETYFEKGKIRLREPVTLSNALCERLGIAGLELPAGILK